MKSFLKNLSVLSMGLLLFSCNEKISAELQDGASTTVPPVIAPTNYYFRLTNDSPTVLNYVLHRTGPNRYGTDKWSCGVNTTTALSSSLYIGEAAVAHDLKNYDITCFMEAEEQSLWHNGLKFGVEASKNTCEYVVYAPYSYYESIAGDSTATYTGLTCADNASDIDANTIANGSGLVYGVGNTPINCGQMLDLSVPTAQRLPRDIPDSKQTLCSFDYTEEGGNPGGGNNKNCDSGRISFSIREVYWTAEVTGPPVIPPALTTRSVVTPRYSCGGSAVSCINGGIKEVSELSGMTRGSLATATELNTDYRNTYTLPKLADTGTGGTYRIANYRRGLANKEVDFVDYLSANFAEWGDMTNGKTFDPELAEKYAANKNPDDTIMIDYLNTDPLAPYSYASYQGVNRANGYTARVISADPFVGLGATNRVNPFYTLYCMDNALEIKARIRLVIRDWDRVFPSTTADLEELSDVYKSTLSRRMDLPEGEDEVPGDEGFHNNYNDAWDWDNYVQMDRTDPNPGMYDPYGPTIYWQPSSGFFATSIFPNR